MFCQIKLPTRKITIAVDLAKIDVIRVEKNPNLEDDMAIYILMYKADIDTPATMVNCQKLSIDETMDLYDWLCACKRGDSVPSVYTMSMLKDPV